MVQDHSGTHPAMYMYVLHFFQSPNKDMQGFKRLFPRSRFDKA